MSAVEHVRVRLKSERQEYSVRIGAGMLAEIGDEARQALTPHARRILIVSNRKVFNLYGARTVASLRRASFQVEHLLIGDGERYKSLRTLEHTLAALSRARLERSDAVVALGGGVVGDLAGLAAALHLRGLAFIQVPTTLLAQIDASVGGKVAVNTSAGKNTIGVFHQPRLVIVDTETLQTLPPRELTAGWCEAVKQGAAGDRRLFDRTFNFLRNESLNITASRAPQLAQLIAAQVAFKASIVAGDEREDVSRSDHRSRRILNFGHTTGHALESVTGYRRFRHGEAVGYGMLVAGELSKKLGLLDGSELELLREAVGSCGRLPRADDLDPKRIISALTADKKSVGGAIKWVLLERLGRARIVDGREITARTLRTALRVALQRVS
ncbi:MAG TPA: 3-dehydroquinate synthase [Pyrinomonadaceae bacterium]|jgi:3-dehydroquinate synthase